MASQLNLAAYGITTETQKMFNDVINAYIDSLGKPRAGIADGERNELNVELEKA